MKLAYTSAIKAPVAITSVATTATGTAAARITTSSGIVVVCFSIVEASKGVGLVFGKNSSMSVATAANNISFGSGGLLRIDVGPDSQYFSAICTVGTTATLNYFIEGDK